MKLSKLLALLFSVLMVMAAVFGCAAPSAPAPTVAPAPQPTVEPAPAPVEESPSETVFEGTIDWDAEYDVVVVGFGGAGAVTAVTAADAGAKVLLLEKAPKGHEGGNTRYAMQAILDFDEADKEDAFRYFKEVLLIDFDTPSDDMLRTFIDYVAENDVWLKEVMGVEPTYHPGSYPEFVGHEAGHAMHIITVDGTTYQSAFWKGVSRMVAERADSIDVWYEAPGKKLIQDPATKIIHGVTAEVDGEMINIRAKNGVVLCTGGFENNQEMIQNYLNIPSAYPKGTLYNEGDGIIMAQEVGAKLWHMSAANGPYPDVLNKNTNRLYGGSMQASAFAKSSAIYVGADGTRFADETETLEHGRRYFHGEWLPMETPSPMFLIFDENARLSGKLYQSWSENNEKELEEGVYVKADTLEDLAEKMGIDPAGLVSEVERYNAMCAAGEDVDQQRPAQFLIPLSTEGPYYAAELVVANVNTQGGPERNTDAQILDVRNNPIPHLYSAGELGSMFSGRYQGAANLAENIAFGRIAGANAAAAKTDVAQKSVMDGKTPFAPATEEEIIVDGLMGEGSGIGGKLVVDVKVEGDTITSVEVVYHNETASVSNIALETVPAAIVAANSTEVDTVSGATLTSKAIIAAVNDALSKK